MHRLKSEFRLLLNSLISLFRPSVAISPPPNFPPLYPTSQLNKLPEVRRFVKNVDEEHVSLYAPDVVVEWKSHKPPVLIVYDDDVELETIPLDKFMTNDLHVLMAKHGFKKSGAEAVEVEEKKEGCEDDGEGR